MNTPDDRRERRRTELSEMDFHPEIGLKKGKIGLNIAKNGSLVVNADGLSVNTDVLKKMIEDALDARGA